jgi:two-component system response regulator DegU
MMKTADVNSLTEAIRAVHLGQSVAHPAIAAKITQFALQNWPDTRRLELLSSRELEILRLIVNDISSQAIAQELGISQRTVESHLGRIYAKLGVPSRMAAAQYYRAHYGTKK